MHCTTGFFRSAQRLLQRAFLLIFPCVFLNSTAALAQTGNGTNPSPCAYQADPKISDSLRTGAPKELCAVLSTKDPATSAAQAPAVTASSPAQPQTTLINHRLLGIVANYTTVETQDQVGRLSAATKFKLTAKTMTDPVTVSFLAGIALLGQARNSDPTFGQGFSGYDKRLATFYADTAIGTLMTSSVFPTALHQDPRYFQLGHGGTRRRLLHAVGSIFVARSDRGALQFNYSQILGNAVAAGISNTYHPEAQRTLGNTLTVWGSDTLLNVLCNVAKEFWPDVRHKLRKPSSD
jgi:hypothetical protein